MTFNETYASVPFCYHCNRAYKLTTDCKMTTTTPSSVVQRPEADSDEGRDALRLGLHTMHYHMCCCPCSPCTVLWSSILSHATQLTRPLVQLTWVMFQCKVSDTLVPLLRWTDNSVCTPDRQKAKKYICAGTEQRVWHYCIQRGTPYSKHRAYHMQVKHLMFNTCTCGNAARFFSPPSHWTHSLVNHWEATQLFWQSIERTMYSW